MARLRWCLWPFLLVSALTGMTCMSVGYANESSGVMSAKSTSIGAKQMPAADFHSKPPFGPQEFWSKLLGLVNEHNGYVMKQSFEQAFGVRFGVPERVKDGEAQIYHYKLHAGAEWYFDVRVSEYDGNYRGSMDASMNGRHSELSVVWKIDSFGSAAHGECVTAREVRDSLVATGWTSPWESWGKWEKLAAADAAALRGSTPYSPPVAIQPRSVFYHQADQDAADRDQLPRLEGHIPQGDVYTTGDQPDSCITGLRVVGRP